MFLYFHFTISFFFILFLIFESSHFSFHLHVAMAILRMWKKLSANIVLLVWCSFEEFLWFFRWFLQPLMVCMVAFDLTHTSMEAHGSCMIKKKPCCYGPLFLCSGLSSPPPWNWHWRVLFPNRNDHDFVVNSNRVSCS